MKRTAKYATQPLNQGKWRELLALVHAFADMKDTFLRILGRTSAWRHLDKPKAFRNKVKKLYRSDIPVHLQDQAVFDAVETMRRFIEAGIASVHLRAKVFVRYQDSDKKRHYAFWLLRSYEHIGALLRGEAPIPKFEIPVLERKEVVRFLRRSLRKALGTPPRVHLRRSAALDDTLYRIFEKNGRQYVAVASLTPGKRLILPLQGKGRISGNVRVVLDFDRKTVAIHMPYEVRVPAVPADGPNIGLDAGVTEVLASSSNEKYGLGYGKLLETLSEETTDTGKARNKLFQIATKAEMRGDGAKASRIRRNNLGRKKLRVKRERGEAAVKTVVGQAVRAALRDGPAVVAVEDLSHLRGRTKSRKLSRIVSRWARSALRERLDFRTQAGCSCLKTVNAAYTSQTCPNPACGFVHRDNRHGDRFHCLECGWDGDADVAAGMNLLARVGDPEIHLWTPVDRVKAILTERFQRRKETGNRDDAAAVSSAAAVQGVVDEGNGTPLPAGLQKSRGNPVPQGLHDHGGGGEETLWAEREQ